MVENIQFRAVFISGKGRVVGSGSESQDPLYNIWGEKGSKAKH